MRVSETSRVRAAGGGWRDTCPKRLFYIKQVSKLRITEAIFYP